jgi:hypothetical protein
VTERNPDDEYFAKLDQEKKEKLRAQLAAEQKTKELEERRLQYWHHCGKCGAKMDTFAYRGHDIEVCPECGATLLDRGELESLAGADRSGAFVGLLDLFGGRKKS